MIAHGFSGGAVAGFGFDEGVSDDADVGAGIVCEVEELGELLSCVGCARGGGTGLTDEISRTFDDGECAGDGGRRLLGD